MIDSAERIKKNIKTFDWPARSPDLNKIEQCWDYEKDTISMYQFTGASQATIESAKDTLLRTWIDYPKDLIERQCLDFHEKCRLVIENGGWNNFHGGSRDLLSTRPHEYIPPWVDLYHTIQSVA
ncbi:hypothetical protein L873DRAFT_1487928 [Choiromyces venosus 120613-1]|uniref:Tc1-like transposase DDE domain-containing protein n=1 Tax=Choiromyces venosus 120613-1 TaxID=1336337 RepID=A0A3N4JBF0_9PEZI|nr:hypothetical protein L873DRAFT_1487928 [Choiromyces venosus 120613-1]